MKKGYQLVDAAQYTFESRSCDFKQLIRTSTKRCAAVLAIFHALNGQTYYFCIPAAGSDPELFQEYISSLKQIDNYEAMKVYSYFITSYFSRSIH